MSKFYAVKKGFKVGIFKNWEDCKSSVNGYPGAIYKSFKNESDALNFLLNTPKQDLPKVKQDLPKVKQDLPEDEYIINIFTDGSHFKKINLIGFSSYCLYKGNVYSFSKECGKDILIKYDIDLNTKVSNPFAEFCAFVETIERIESIEINERISFVFNIDYIGVANWINGSWKCKENHIRKLKNKADILLKNIKNKISIQHISAHSGNIHNDAADKLAKSGAKGVLIDNFNDLFLALKND